MDFLTKKSYPYIVKVRKNKSMNKKGPIFIVGSPRSGTSLLSKIISNHSKIGIPFESHVYPRLYPWKKCYGNISINKNKERIAEDIVNLEPVKKWKKLPDVREVVENIGGGSFHDAFGGFMEAWLHKIGKDRWGEKTPHNVFFGREISEGFPNSKFIHIVRDGRDVAISWKKVRFGPEHFYSISNLWRDHVKKAENIKNKVSKDRFHEVKYEDILKSPKSSIRKICAFLDESFDSKMMNFYKESGSYPTDDRNERNLSRPLLRDNMNKWVSDISARNLRIVESVAGETLERHGYELGYQNASLSQREIWQMRFIECPVTRMFGVLKDVEGVREAVRSLPLYLRLALECYLGISCRACL